MTSRPLFAAGLLVALAAPTAAPLIAAEAVLTEETLPEATLVSADEQGVVFKVRASQRRTPWRELSRWGARVAPRPRPLVVLRDGSEIVAAPTWTRAGSVTLEGDAFTIRSATLQSLALPRAAVGALLFEAAKDPELRWAFYQAASERTAATAEDEVHLVDGDVLTGGVTAIANGVLTLTLADETVQVPLKSITAVRLAGTPDRPEPDATLLVGLKDGSLLQATRVTMDTEKPFKLLLAGGQEVAGRKREGLVFLQPLGTAVYLSDLTPLDYRHTPYAGVAWPLGRNESLLGGPLRSSGRPHAKGLAMHSPSRVVYRLTPGEQTRLDFTMALDDAANNAAQTTGAGQGGSVVYRVLIAKQAGFQTAFQSGVVRSRDTPQPVSVDVTGARAIALVIEPADYGDRLDHALWLDARLIKADAAP